MKNSKITFWAIVDSLGIFLYISLLGLMFVNVSKVGDHFDNFLGPILFLSLFVISAVVTGSLFLGRPVLLYLDNQKKEAIKLFLYTLVFLILWPLIVLVIRLLI